MSPALPPGVEGSAYGNLFIEIGDLGWLIYDTENYLEEMASGKGVHNLFANMKFWGDNTKGLYLR